MKVSSLRTSIHTDFFKDMVLHFILLESLETGGEQEQVYAEEVLIKRERKKTGGWDGEDPPLPFYALPKSFFNFL